ncbi:DUF2946 family protein [Hyphomonas sp.]|uniref:DUF2946 family protein n=1 Tax=Hyphomonas sp. TaxID=87 RepID=UPI00391D198F
MWGTPAIFLGRLLVLLALMTQALMPGAMAAASSRPGDLPAVLCAMPDGMGGAATGTGSELARLIAEKSKSGQTGETHDCPACTLSQTAALPQPVVLTEPLSTAAAQTAPLYEVRFAQVPRGPPVGSRAPPPSTAL